MTIRLAEDDRQIAECFPVMRQLRPHLAEEQFVPRIRLQQQHGYRLLRLDDGNRVLACAGFRFLETLAWAKLLYVDDLVTDEAARSTGAGRQMMDWLIAHARQNGCQELHLDSGVQRFDAHRFYLRCRMAITCHHFAMKL